MYFVHKIEVNISGAFYEASHYHENEPSCQLKDIDVPSEVPYTNRNELNHCVTEALPDPRESTGLL